MNQNKNIKIKNAAAAGKNSGDFFFNPQGDFYADNDFYAEEGQLSCDIYQDNESIIVKSTMAGVDPDNLDIAVSNDVLTIRGFRETDEETANDDFLSREIYWGAFSRSIVLPQEVEQKKVQASLKNGVLTIKLPKKYKTTAIKVKQLDD